MTVAAATFHHQLNWEFITEQIGMFAYTGMTKEMCEKLINKHHIFLTKVRILV